MHLIGVTGGIAAGKTPIARRLKELGAHHIDADVLAREVVEPGEPALDAIARRFGDDVLNSDGSLDRARLGEIVFGDEEALAALNNIVHPAVHQLAHTHMREISHVDPDAVIVYDIPLLVEAGRDAYPWDVIIVAEAPIETRIERLTKLRHMTRGDAEARIRTQASDDARRAVADVVIDTSGTFDETIAQVDRLWNEFSSRRLAAGDRPDNFTV